MKSSAVLCKEVDGAADDTLVDDGGGLSMTCEVAGQAAYAAYAPEKH